MIAAVVMAILCVPAIAIAGTAPGIAYVAGLIGFYGVYEVLHRLEHTSAGIGPYARWARRHHFHHHFVDARENHGVTSPLWDVVFGTYRKPGPIKVPPKLCMPWLKDPETGDIRAAHADTFVLGKTADPAG
jgi:sterol desaturase/sphingolipid hydroxylase (fatty acid hydroxylase superfamily)